MLRISILLAFCIALGACSAPVSTLVECLARDSTSRPCQ